MTATKSLLVRAGLYLSAKEFRYIMILIDNTAIYQLLSIRQKLVYQAGIEH